jgi:hypothetical protein
VGYISGTIEKVFSKELPQEDRFQNKYRRAIKLAGNDAWFGLGPGKTPAVNVKDGKQFRELHEGSVVEFMYSERESSDGKIWYDTKCSDIKVKSWGEGQSGYSKGSEPPPPKADAASTATPAAGKPASASTGRVGGSTSGTDWAKKDAGAAASASVDKAIAYLTATQGLGGGHEDDMNLIYDISRHMQSIVRKLAEEILHTTTATSVAEKPKATPVKPSIATKQAVSPPAKTKAPTKEETEDELAIQRTSWDDEEEYEEETTPF